MKARNLIFSAVFCLSLMAPCALWVTQEGLRLQLPAWLTSEDAAYLAGGISESNLKEHLSLASFETEEFQNALDSEIENHIPAKAQVLLINAALQRFAIAASNALMGFDAYPTFFGSKTIYLPQDNALADYPSTKAWTLKRTKKTGEGVVSVAEHEPEKNFYLVVADMSYTSQANPAHALVSDALSTTDYLEVLHECIKGTPNVHLVSLPYDNPQEYYANYYRTDHHWNGFGTIALYDALRRTAQLPYDLPRPETVLSFPGVKTNGSYARDGLMLLNEPVEEPAFDLSHITVQNDTIPPVAQVDGVQSVLAAGPRAEFSFYTEWFGSSFLTAQSPLSNSAALTGKRAVVIMDSYADSLHWLLAPNYAYLRCYRDIRDGEESDVTLLERIEEVDANDVYIIGSTSAFTRPPKYLPHYFDLPEGSSNIQK